MSTPLRHLNATTPDHPPSFPNVQKAGCKNNAKRHRKPFSFKLWLSSKWDDAQGSLFFEPSLGVAGAVCLAVVLMLIDKHYTSNNNSSVPVILQTTDASARTILSTVAGATISFAGTAFSLSLLVFQMGSTTYSPRITHTLFRDSYNRRVMGFNVGVFSYCLVIMRSVRLPGDPDDDDDDLKIVVPNLSVAVAMVLGIFSILSIVAFIDHAAHSLDISELLHRVHAETVVAIERDWSSKGPVSTSRNRDGDEGDDFNALEGNSSSPGSDDSNQNNSQSSTYHVVRFRQSGWVQEFNLEALAELVNPHGHIKILTTPGRFAIRGSPACEVAILIDEKKSNNTDVDDKTKEPDWDTIDTLILDNIALGRVRTMRDDPAFGLRQTVDVTLRALSPGVNDPTTAQDSIFHAASLVVEFLTRDPPPSVIRTQNNGALLLTKQQTHDGIVTLAYNEVRVCAAASPTVCLYLLESLRLIRASLDALGLPGRGPEIERQVQLIEANIKRIPSHVMADQEAIAQTRSEDFPSVIPIVENGNYKGALLNDLAAK